VSRKALPSQAWQHTPIILAFRRLRQEDCKVQASLQKRIKKQSKPFKFLVLWGFQEPQTSLGLVQASRSLVSLGADLL
jgi:hypothetical protein